MLKQWKFQEISSGLLLTAGGLILLFVPELTLVTIANAVGIVLIIIGAIFIFSYICRKQMAAGNNDLVKGIVTAGIGLFICVRSEAVISILPVLLGVGVVVSGILKLQHAFDLRRMAVSAWTKVMITAAINILIGLIVILNPFSTVAFLMRLIGVGLIFSGLTDVITTIYVSKKASEYYVDGEAEE